jgi:hypothetical protein
MFQTNDVVVCEELPDITLGCRMAELEQFGTSIQQASGAGHHLMIQYKVEGDSSSDWLERASAGAAAAPQPVK